MDAAKVLDVEGKLEGKDRRTEMKCYANHWGCGLLGETHVVVQLVLLVLLLVVLICANLRTDAQTDTQTDTGFVWGGSGGTAFLFGARSRSGPRRRRGAAEGERAARSGVSRVVPTRGARPRSGRGARCRS